MASAGRPQSAVGRGRSRSFHVVARCRFCAQLCRLLRALFKMAILTSALVHYDRKRTRFTFGQRGKVQPRVCARDVA